MKFSKLLSYISEEELAFLSVETKVDQQVKKLKGEIMFKLLLYSLLESNKPSLRVLEQYFNSSKFQFLANTSKVNTKYNSISDRLTTINSDYFERIFNLLFEKYSRLLKQTKSIQIYDSTMIGLSSKLVDWSMRLGRRTNKVQLKFTVGIQGDIPCTFKIFSEAKDLCEDNTIPKAILEYRYNKSGIVVFDRGVQKRTTFIRFSEEDIIFVSRIKTSINYHLVDTIDFKEELNQNIEIIEDLKINFIERGSKKKLPTEFRLVKGIINTSQKEIYFITNNFELSPYEIADIYKRRWEVEVFFKYIKQELNFKYLMNRSLNGIKVTVYMTLILAMLIQVYKKLNKLKGFKIVKVKIANEIHDSLLREIIVLSGGNPDLVGNYLNDS
ncbi:MAG: IS4 family transposase [Flavobacteriales bacterium]|nr:IS4 family transposase [Flavobacteriales bacterium]